MAWQPAARPSFQVRTLPHRIYQFQHAAHGQLLVTRHNKTALTNQITYQLQLTSPAGAIMNGAVTLYVSDNDFLALAPPRVGTRGGGAPHVAGGSSVGYGQINLGNLTGRRIIYVIHHVFALAGRELGVANLVVDGVVNPNLDTACGHCGMETGLMPNYYQAPCGVVSQRSYARALHHGWA